MTQYAAPLPEMLSLMRHLGGLDPDDDAVPALLEAAGTFAAERLAPLNSVGDRQGLRWSPDGVATPDGFREAYAEWIAGGWNAVSAPESAGGAGLPCIVATALTEIWTSANMAFAMLPVLNQGAMDAMLHHASAELKERWLPRMVSGAWAATMALTEPQAGSDLSLLRSRAEPVGDGSYRIRGNKIFISYGAHDFTDNIIHLVLARLPDAPPGTRGISLFLVPKILPDGTSNDVRCTGVEHKLGIHASPTCAMAFGDQDGAIGWLIGKENAGLAAMFTMMNRARLATGLQGVSLAERALQQATAFAATRVQGRNAAGKATTIDAHPDVRRMLRAMRAATLAARAIAYSAACAIDLSERTGSAEAEARAALLTPIVKAISGNAGFDVASLNIQVHGGMGYVEETGAAQLLRDARIIPVYEGTNGIQAIDFTQRKVQRDNGAAVRAEIALWRATALEAASGNDAALTVVARELDAAIGAVESAVAWVLDPANTTDDVLTAATPFLDLFGLAAGGAFLTRAALSAARDPADSAAPVLRDAALFHATQKLPLAPGMARCVTDAAVAT